MNTDETDLNLSVLICAPSLAETLFHSRFQRLQVFGEMLVQNLRVRLRMLAQDLFDLRAELCVREHRAEGRVEDLPARLGEAAVGLHILPALQVNLLERRCVANVRRRRG